MSLAPLIQPRSLSETIDAVSQAMADEVQPPARERTEIARWIASRQGQPGAYANTFAGFEHERLQGIRLFSGERVVSASARHILGEEACRTIIQLRVRDRAVQQALALATEGLLQCLARAAADPRHPNPGLFCCGKCTVGLWRHLSVGGLDRQSERLQKGIPTLRQRRDSKGGWRAFPFWYTVQLLAEVDLPSAKAELRYAAGQIERAASGRTTSTLAHRRRWIAARALAVI